VIASLPKRERFETSKVTLSRIRDLSWHRAKAAITVGYMLTTTPAEHLADWDTIIERAQHAPHVEDKLIVTAAQLATAQQRSRLLGQSERVSELGQRLRYVQELLDQN
jgi:hypothetical protein